LNSSGLSEERCPAGRSRFVIGPDGGIYGCDLLMVPAFLEGNAPIDDLGGYGKMVLKKLQKQRNV